MRRWLGVRRHAWLATVLFTVLSATLATADAPAQTWPAKPVRIVASTAAGGAPDILARILANRISERLGQGVIVDLRPGGSGVIAAEYVMQSPADGYTWLLSTTTTLAVTPHLRNKLPYDTQKDFIPLSLIASSANVLLVGRHVPAASAAELVTLIKSRPGKFSYGSAGIGSPAHLAGELFDTLAGTTMTHVSYKGAAQALNDVAGGQIDLIMTSPVAAKAFLQGDRVKALATTGAKRDPSLPQLPPLGEVLPGYEITQWWGMMLRTGTPAAIVERIHRELIATLSEPRIRELITAQGAAPQPMSRKEFAEFIVRERTRYGDLVRRAKVPMED